MKNSFFFSFFPTKGLVRKCQPREEVMKVEKVREESRALSKHRGMEMRKSEEFERLYKELSLWLSELRDIIIAMRDHVQKLQKLQTEETEETEDIDEIETKLNELLDLISDTASYLNGDMDSLRRALIDYVYGLIG